MLEGGDGVGPSGRVRIESSGTGLGPIGRGRGKSGGGGWWLAAQGRWDEATAEGYVLEGGSGVGPNGRVPASRGEAG